MLTDFVQARAARAACRRAIAEREPTRDRLLLDHRGAAVASPGRDLARLARGREPARPPRHLAAGRRAPSARGRHTGADDGRQLARTDRPRARARTRSSCRWPSVGPGATGAGPRHRRARLRGRPGEAPARLHPRRVGARPPRPTRRWSSPGSTAIGAPAGVRFTGQAGARRVPGARAPGAGVRRRAAPRGLRDRAARGARRRVHAGHDPLAGPVPGARSRAGARPAPGRTTTSRGACERRSTSRTPITLSERPGCWRRSAARRLMRPSPSASCHDCCQRDAAVVHPQPVRERIQRRSALLPRVRDRVRVRRDRGDHRLALGLEADGRRSRPLLRGRDVGLPRGPDRRADLLPDHDPEPDPRPLVGSVRDLEGRARDLGRDRRGRGGRPLHRQQTPVAPGAAPVHGRRRAGTAVRPGDRPDRQLLQPGAVRRPDQAAVGRWRSPARTGSPSWRPSTGTTRPSSRPSCTR